MNRSRRRKNTPKLRRESTVGEIADDHYQKLARERVQADLEKLTGKKPSSLKFNVVVPPMARFRGIMEMSIPRTGHGRPLAGETARVIKAEAFRKLTRDGSMRKMAKMFFTDKPQSERYDRYRAVVAQHADKVKELLRFLEQ
jgi:hypothetical protein